MKTSPAVIFSVLAATLLVAAGFLLRFALTARATRDSHARMVSLLDEIRGLAANHRFSGTQELEAARKAVVQLPAAALPPQRFRLQMRAGYQELRHGHNRAAVDHFSAAVQLIPQVSAMLPEDEVRGARLQLAIAYLRLGESENCVAGHTPESCLLPIAGAGVHVRQEGSRRAAEVLRQVLAEQPDNLTARWLLNIAHMTLGEYPAGVPDELRIPPAAFRSAESSARLANVAAKLGLDTVSLAGGCAVDDFDNDGLLDLFVSDWSLDGQLRYFHHEADGSFVDLTERAGLTGLVGGLNLVHADYDNDGLLDLLVLRGAWLGEDGRHPNSLIRNEGNNVFRDVTFEAGLGDEHFPTLSAAWADYNNDGLLDLFVGNELFPSQLFENQGLGRFRDVAARAGVQNGRTTKGASWGDFDGDRFPDLYVSNLDGPNRLYRNNRDGTFTDVAEQLGVAGPSQGFATWFWDYNNDGRLDLYASSYEMGVEHVAAEFLGLPDRSEPDCLYEGSGEGRFREVAAERGLQRVTQPMGANFGDLDNDGFLDFYLGTGYPEFEALMPNLLYRNRGGRRFVDVTFAAGVGHLQKGHGIAFADLDNDGDQDLFAQMGGFYPGDAFANALFENPGSGAHFLSVKLVGRRSNRSAIGARLHVVVDENGTERSIFRWVNTGGSFGSSPLRREIGLGGADRIQRLEIYWPAGDTRQVFTELAADQFVEIHEGDDELRILRPVCMPLSRVKGGAAPDDHRHDHHAH